MNLTIRKEGAAAPSETQGELEFINRFARTELSAEQVYTFSVLLCDNEVDRDFEQFSLQTLSELQELFVGRTGIADHDWRSEKQVARLYRTELVRPQGQKNSLGEDYAYLKGYAYMLRCEENAPLIEAIDGGIKREVSVGCSVARVLCSVCGQELGSAGCSHIKGREYEGGVCYGILDGAVDAYEWSFVAVPAQRSAGVIKRFGQTGDLKGFVCSEEGRAFAPAFEALEKEAAFGRLCARSLREEVRRLALLCDPELGKALTLERMEPEELSALKQALEKRASELFPPLTQLPGRKETVRFDNGEFLI